ncbi:methyltransferase domain-containing protein [Nocardioides nanhaiensis]|uniref:Methyltransferase domain-containing protein n=1 Tax=Nocardioides nanhaiensis TaxID=1476871 RepID=A0ABP8WUP0_9ACTN
MTDRRPDRLNSRQRRLWDLHDFSSGRGLEIGPLHNPSVRHEHGAIEYLDVFSREQLLRNYAGHANVDPAAIPEVDHVLMADDGRVRSIPETLDGIEPFDWVMASHVIEHVPDMIGWLDQVAQVTVDGGALVLVVPDRRYCFDVHRPGTTLGQLLQAHEAGDVVPSVRAVYDYKRGHVGTNAAALWRGEVPGYGARLYDLPQVVEQVDAARRGEYIDAHVWALTPGTLLEQLVELRQLGLSAWRVESLVPTARNLNEFYAVLRRLPRGGGWPASLLADEPRPEHEMPDWVAEQVELRERQRELRSRLDARKRRIARLEKQLQRARGEVRRLREQQAPADSRSLPRRAVGRLRRALRR